MSRPVAALAVPVAALVVVALGQARAQPELAPGGEGAWALGVQLAAGLALIVAALDATRRREAAVGAALLAAAMGLALHALPAPPDGALLFALALVGGGVAPAGAAHAALVYPRGAVSGGAVSGGAAPRGGPDRAAFAAGYAVSLCVLGLLPALVFDPRAAGCFACPDNLLLVHGDPALADRLATWGPRLAAVTWLALAVLVLLRLVQRPAAACSIAAPVSAAAAAVLALSAVSHLRATGGLAAEELDRNLWLATAAALGLLAAGFVWRPLRAARVRGALARLTVAPPANDEDVRATLSRAVGDPELAIVLPHPETGAPLGDATPPPGRVRTAVERRGRVVAWLEHGADAQASPELARTAGLMLERGALRAAQRLQQEELQASTLRLVTAGEAERRRLERDLHDGAQQRLLALGLGLTRARAAAVPDDAATLGEAARRVSALNDELRGVAHGIHSVTLAEGGLAEAVLALIDASGGGVAVDALPEQRGTPEAEAAVYRLVAASLRHAGHGGARLAIRAEDGELQAAIDIPGADLADALAHAGARFAALGGSVMVNGGAVQARVPARR